MASKRGYDAIVGEQLLEASETMGPSSTASILIQDACEPVHSISEPRIVCHIIDELDLASLSHCSVMM